MPAPIHPPAFWLAPAEHPDGPPREEIARLYRADEAATVRALLGEAELAPEALERTQSLAASLARGVRAARTRAGGVDALMLEFSLDSREGVALMCLAEALLRIPDLGHARPADPRQDRRAATGARTSAAARRSSSTPRRGGCSSPGSSSTRAATPRSRQAIASLLRKGGEPLIRKGVDLAMRLLGKQFVTGRTIDGSDRQRARARSARLPFSLRHAGRSRADRGRRASAISPRTRTAIDAIGDAAGGSRGLSPDRASRSSSRRCIRATRGAQRERVLAELLPARRRRSRTSRTQLRHRPQHRRRGSRPARSVARSSSSGSRPIRRSPAGTASASSCRRTRSARGP